MPTVLSVRLMQNNMEAEIINPQVRRVIGIGETVLDIIFKDNQPIGAIPGGSTFNSIISLGRCGVNTSFISEAGNDRVGRMIIDFLHDNGVNADAVSVFPESKSPLSLAFLDEHNDAEYIFYKDHPHDQLDFVYPEIHREDIIIFGSFYAVNPVIRQQVQGVLDRARAVGAIIYYDVNYRPSHKNDVIKIKPNLLDNLEFADIVRGSREDFLTLYNMDDAKKIYRSEISFYCRKFIFTNGAKPVELYAEGGFNKEYPVLDVPTVSTVGAGDNFNAGLIYGIIKNNIFRDDIDNGLTEDQWDKIIASAQLFSAECCKDIYNYVSKEFGRGIVEG